MRNYGDFYKHIAVHADNLLIASKDPEKIINCLLNDHEFKLKGTRAIKYHLGYDFFRDSENTLCFVPKKYIEKLISLFLHTFSCKLNTKVHSSLEKGDYPELDTSDVLDKDRIEKYQSLIGAL